MSNTNTNTNTNTMNTEAPNAVTSLTKAIKEILVVKNGIATTKEVLAILAQDYPLVKTSYRPVFGTLRRLGALAQKTQVQAQEVVEEKVQALQEEVQALKVQAEVVVKPVRKRNAKGHFIKA